MKRRQISLVECERQSKIIDRVEIENKQSLRPRKEGRGLKFSHFAMHQLSPSFSSWSVIDFFCFFSANGPIVDYDTPSFGNTQTKVVVQEGSHAFFHCAVHNLANRTVRLIWKVAWFPLFHVAISRFLGCGTLIRTFCSSAEIVLCEKLDTNSFLRDTEDGRSNWSTSLAKTPENTNVKFQRRQKWQIPTPSKSSVSLNLHTWHRLMGKNLFCKQYYPLNPKGFKIFLMTQGFGLSGDCCTLPRSGKKVGSQSVPFIRLPLH